MDSRLIDIITGAARKNNVSPEVLIRTAQLESGGNTNAKNPNSSAGGLFQFIDSTAKQYGLGDRFNPHQAADAAARLTADNAAFLKKKLGREPTGPELYLAHQQGAQGAINILSNPNASAMGAVGEKAISLNGGSGGMSSRQFSQKWEDRYNGGQGSPQPYVQQVPTQGQIKNQSFMAGKGSPSANTQQQSATPLAANTEQGKNTLGRVGTLLQSLLGGNNTAPDEGDQVPSMPMRQLGAAQTPSILETLANIKTRKQA